MAKKIQKEKIDNVGIHSFSKKADIFFSIISGLLAFSCILPFIFVIIISITDEKSIVQYGYSFFPSKFGVDGFQFLAQFKDKILQALFISAFVTVVGTLTNVLDVYVFNGLTQTADIGMASAAGLYQSVVGLILVILSNLLARRVDPNSALF